MAAARALATDPEAREQALAITADFLSAENEVLALWEAGEGLSSENTLDTLWWRRFAAAKCGWRQGAEALRVPIPARVRLLRDSYAMAEQPRAIDRTRINEGVLAITSLTATEIAALEKALGM